MSNTAYEVVQTLVEQWNQSPLAEDEKRVLATDQRMLDETEKQTLGSLLERALRGYMTAAADGFEFVDSRKIQDRFGTTLSRNYPEAGATFLRFATTYWTFKILLSQEPFNKETNSAAAILNEIEGIIGPLFFPVPGPAQIDPDRRELDQREFLAETAPQINIEEFMAQNPILIRDRGGSRGGCLGSVAIAVAGVVTLLLLV